MTIKGKTIVDLIRDSEAKMELVLLALEFYCDGNPNKLDTILELEREWIEDQLKEARGYSE